MEQNQNAFAPEAATAEPASPFDFEPVPVRARHDGWTPEKQREFIEALADTGIVREAAARVGMTEQSAWRLRRRADAAAFDIAWEAAAPAGARRLHSLAWERAIEGTVKGHFYHGELKSEERVFDNRLLICLLGRTQALVERPVRNRRAFGEWEGWMQAIEQGLPEPPRPEPQDEDEFDGSEVWETEGGWWTDFPPPAGFDGIEEGSHGSSGYRRTLSEAERALVDSWRAEQGTDDHARRDRFFGFEGGRFSSPWEPNL